MISAQPRHRRSRSRRRNRWPPVMAMAVACGALLMTAGLVGLGLSWHAPARAKGIQPAAGLVAVPRGRQAPVPGPFSPRLVARPVQVVIPVIGVKSRLVRLGVSRSGTMQVPATAAVAGWYTASPRPGAIGSAVIAGHIDSYRGPGVFYMLRGLRPGDRVFVRRADGSLAVFRVRAVREYSKTAFPRAAVFGPVPDAELRLITCGGTFDYATRSYLSNVVVFAALVR